MITLKTGVPGSGKTLSAVAELAGALRSDPGRPLFVHGVKNLVIPHRVLTTRVTSGGQKTERREVDGQTLVVVVEEEDPGSTYEVDWGEVPDGALVMIDEAQQRVFPPRGPASKVPSYVAFLNTHRHRGIDIWCVTQHPKLVDQALRRLVGKHQHYRRVWGGARAVCYEWDACSDSLNFRQGTKGLFNYPRAAYALYKSAEVHTRQRFRLPVWLLVPMAAIPLGVMTGPRAFEALHGAATGRGVAPSGRVASAPAASSSVPSARATSSSSSSVGVPVAASSPSVVASAAVVAAGCMSMGSSCLCVDAAGARMRVELDVCREAAREYGGLVPYPTTAVRDVRAPEAHGVASAGVGLDRPSEPFGFTAGDYRDRHSRGPLASAR